MATFPPPDLKLVANEVGTLLKNRHETISVAETAAGGIISASLLSISGASAFYKGGLTIYTLESRVAFAGWTQTQIDQYRGPSPEVVSGIAENVRKSLGSTYTVCESGTAGPTGGNTRNRTPGYVALAVASERGTVTHEVEGLGADREKNMATFASEALVFLRDVIKGSAKI